MIKPDDPRKLAEDLLSRSTCAVQVAAVIADNAGIFSWGWNHQGFGGFGAHAEVEAIRRANKKRLSGATIYVASKRRKSGNALLSKPCDECQKWLWAYGIGQVVYRDKEGVWRG